VSFGGPEIRFLAFASAAHGEQTDCQFGIRRAERVKASRNKASAEVAIFRGYSTLKPVDAFGNPPEEFSCCRYGPIHISLLRRLVSERIGPLYHDARRRPVVTLWITNSPRGPLTGACACLCAYARTGRASGYDLGRRM
jgi:hypothetical protein